MLHFSGNVQIGLRFIYLFINFRLMRLSLLQDDLSFIFHFKMLSTCARPAGGGGRIDAISSLITTTPPTMWQPHLPHRTASLVEQAFVPSSQAEYGNVTNFINTMDPDTLDKIEKVWIGCNDKIMEGNFKCSDGSALDTSILHHISPSVNKSEINYHSLFDASAPVLESGVFD